MPIVRYVLFVGGALLGLLMLADWYFPAVPTQVAAHDIDRSIIRIHTSEQWPAAVHIDTNAAVPQGAAPAPFEQSAQVTPPSKPPADAYVQLASPESKPFEAKSFEAKPSGSKLAEKRQRHITRLARLSKRMTHRRMIAWQPLWQPPWQSTW